MSIYQRTSRNSAPAQKSAEALGEITVEGRLDSTASVDSATVQAAEVSADAGAIVEAKALAIDADSIVEGTGVAKIANGDEGTRIVFPVAFPTAIESIVCTSKIGVSVSFSATPDGLGAATIRHNGDGGVETYYHAVGK